MNTNERNTMNESTMTTVTEPYEHNTFQSAILYGLQSKPIYHGTVEPQEVARRRAKAKAARIARRANR